MSKEVDLTEYFGNINGKRIVEKNENGKKWQEFVDKENFIEFINLPLIGLLDVKTAGNKTRG